MLLQRKSKSF